MDVDAPNDVVDALTCDDRSQLLALRMLQGSAAASVFAYRLGETLDPVVHGVTADGVLAVVAVPQGRWADEPSGRAVDVRLDLVKNSLDPRVSMVAASAHALGTLVWASPDEIAHRAQGQLPPLLMESLQVPGARLGLVTLERIVLHDLSGAVVVPHTELALGGPALAEELTGTSLIASRSNSELQDLCWSVMVGRTPGTVSRKAHGGNTCAHTLNTVFCADIDAIGVTVVLVAAHELVVVHARFEEVADSVLSLEEQVARLVAGSASARAQRTSYS